MFIRLFQGCIREYAVELDSAALHLARGPAALWKKPDKHLLMCKHNTDVYPSFSALLQLLRTLYHTGPGKGKVIR